MMIPKVRHDGHGYIVGGYFRVFGFHVEQDLAVRDFYRKWRRIFGSVYDG